MRRGDGVAFGQGQGRRERGSHCNYDCPGIAIARRIIGQGAQPWRLGCADYREAVERLPLRRRLPLTGRAETTRWDSGLGPAMMADNVATGDLGIQPGPSPIIRTPSW